MNLIIPSISVYQPWAELLVAGIKPIENRPRVSNHKGPLLIHAAKKFDAKWSEKLNEEALKLAKEHLKKVCSFPTELPKGCIVGFVIQTGCVKPLDPIWPPHPSCKWYEGQYGLLMEYPVKFTSPIPYTGRQGMFKADVKGMITPADIVKIVQQISRWKHGN